MSQLDVPQVSLARYVDLLKRRRWQVVPISILGLLIGGIVAFFIPRYFVAVTQIHYRPGPNYESADVRDPFGGLVDTAKLTIPLAIPQTVKDLGWPEGLSEDPYELSENAKAIEGRLDVFEFGSSRERNFVLIRVTYKDRDGQRAADFLNALVDNWIGQERATMRADAERALADARDEMTRQRDAFDTYLGVKKHLETKYRIQPDVPRDIQMARYIEQQAAQDIRKTAVEQERQRVARLEQTIAVRSEQLAAVPVRIPVDRQKQLAAIKTTEPGQQLLLLIEAQELRRNFFRETQIQWAIENRRLELLYAKMLELVPEPLRGDEAGTMANPDHVLVTAAIDKLELELGEARADLQVQEGALARENERLEQLVEGYSQYAKNAELLKQTQQAQTAASDRMQRANEELGKLTSQPTVNSQGQASVPPAPTDPNLMLVALVGCAIGLFAAMALILLLDVMQATFKTVVDVERGLDVPVLGGISHLETEAQRRQGQRTRARATMLVLMIAALLTGVVLIYLYDPARLPPFLRDILAAVLGAE